MLAHHNAAQPGVFAREVLHGEAKLESRPHPGQATHFLPVNLFRQFLAVCRGRHRDDGVWMRVVHVFRRDERVQGCIDGRGARVQVERAVIIHRHHVVLCRRLEALVFARGVNLLEVEQFLLVEGGKIFPSGRAEVATGTFDPEHFNRLARDGVPLGDLGRSIAAAGVGDAPIGAQLVGPIDKAADSVKL